MDERDIAIQAIDQAGFTAYKRDDWSMGETVIALGSPDRSGDIEVWEYALYIYRSNDQWVVIDMTHPDYDAEYFDSINEASAQTVEILSKARKTRT